MIVSKSTNFTINGVPLLSIIKNKTSFGGDYLGCFASGFENLNEPSFKQLLVIEPPETVDGRCLLYVCTECADIGCGAIGCKVSKNETKYIWSDFAYVNGYEEPAVLENIGPYEFDKLEYEAIINLAKNL